MSIVLAFMAVCVFSAVGADTHRTIDMLDNGDFEMYVETPTVPAADNLDLYGAYWCNSEGFRQGDATKIYDEGGTQRRVLKMSAQGDYVYQMFPVYEYIKEATSTVVGKSDTLKIKGKVKFDTSIDMIANVIVEETRWPTNSYRWGAPLRQAPEAERDLADNLDEDWTWLARNASSGVYEEMTWDEVVVKAGRYVAPSDITCRCSTGGSSNSGTIVAGEDGDYIAVAVFDPEDDGDIRLQCRVSSPKLTAQAPNSMVYKPQFRCVVYQDWTASTLTMGSEKSVLCNWTEVGLDSDGITRLDLSFGKLLTLDSDDVIAFELKETVTTGTSASSESVMIHSNISYEGARQVIHRIGSQRVLDAYTVSDDTTTVYGPDTVISSTGSWSNFTLNVGSEYFNHFDQYDTPDHGPVGPLELRIELWSNRVSGAVRFDDMESEIDFLYNSDTVFDDELQAIVGDLVDLHMTYGVKEDSADMDYPVMPAWGTWDVIDGSHSGSVSSASDFNSNIIGFLVNATARYYWEDATPWLLDAGEAAWINRDEDLGFMGRYDVGNETWVSYADNNKISPKDVSNYLDLYELTGDVLYLDAAYELGTAIANCTPNPATPPPSNPQLPHFTDALVGELKYRDDGRGNVWIEENEPSAGTISNSVTSWSSIVGWMTRLYARCHDLDSDTTSSGRYPDHDDFLNLPIQASEWIQEQRDNPYWWRTWWDQIDYMFGDAFGYNANSHAPAWVNTGETTFLDMMVDAIDLGATKGEISRHFQETMYRSCVHNSDAERGWDAFLHGAARDLVSPYDYAYEGQRHLEAIDYYVKYRQTGNGAWTELEVGEFQVPNWGHAGKTGSGAPSGGLYHAPCMAYLFEPLQTIGVVTTDIKNDLYAYLQTMLRVQEAHQNHYFEQFAGCSDQYGWMLPSYYPVDITALPTAANERAAAGHLRQLSAIPLIADIVQERLDAASTRRRPTCSITPGTFGFDSTSDDLYQDDQEFNVGDLDGRNNISAIWIEQSIFDTSGDKIVTIYNIPDDHLTVSYPAGNNDILIEWADDTKDPDLQSGYTYRFRLFVVDNDDRWDMTTVVYEID